MTLKKLFVVRFVKHGSRRRAYVRRVDQKDAWIRVKMVAAERMLRNGNAVEDDRGGRPA